MQASRQGRDTSTGAWAPDGTLYVGSSGTHLRQFDPVTFESMRDITVPTIATGGTLQFSDDGAFVVGRGTIQLDGDCAAISGAHRPCGRTRRMDDRPRGVRSVRLCVFAFSVPEDRLWCADFSGVIRGRSLSNGELDGTTVEHQRSGLSSMAVQSVGGHRYLIAFGQQSAFIGRWQIDGAGPIARNVADGYEVCRVQP